MFDEDASHDNEPAKPKSAHSKSWDIAKTAFGLIVKHDTSADPKSFAVWYAYAAEKKPDLNAAIDEILSQNIGISAADIMQLYDLHVDEQSDAEEKLETISQEIQSQVAGAKSLVTEVISSTDEYVTTIGKAKSLLPADSSPEQLRGTIDGLIEQTQTSQKAAQDIQVALQSKEDEITALGSKVVQLRTTLMRDTVTELMNQHKFESALKEESANAIANGYSLTVMIAGVKNIQALNEAAGSDISEFILKSVSSMLRKSVGDHGVCARFAGSRFAIMLPKAVYRDAGLVAKKIKDELDLFKIVKKPSEQYVGHIECFMGGSSLRPDMSATDLIRTATEQAMIARETDKDTVKFDLTLQSAA